MGQYWEWLCTKDDGTKERLSTHELGVMLKWFEQWGEGTMYKALQLLKTDTSSLGHGGGVLQVEHIPAILQQFVKPILGRWFGARIDFVGDYTESEFYQDYKNDDNDHKYTDITSQVALAILAVEHEWFDETLTAAENLGTLKKYLLKQSKYTDWDQKNFYSIIASALRQNDKRKRLAETGDDKKRKRSAETETEERKRAATGM